MAHQQVYKSAGAQKATALPPLKPKVAATASKPTITPSTPPTVAPDLRASPSSGSTASGLSRTQWTVVMIVIVIFFAEALLHPSVIAKLQPFFLAFIPPKPVAATANAGNTGDAPTKTNSAVIPNAPKSGNGPGGGTYV